MNNYFEVLNLELDSSSKAGNIRQAVLEATSWSPTPTTNIPYTSANRLLIVGEIERASEIESRLPEKIFCYIAVPAEKSGSSATANAYRCSGLAISGYLGRFEALIDQENGGDPQNDNNNLAKTFNIESGLFDQVLDLSETPLVTAAIKPPGYYHASDSTTLDGLIESIPEMIGEFEKPKYFNYDPLICAHGRSGVTGCTRCIDACPTDAIFSIGETIEVNSHLCQGGGTCASSCPSGAISYAYPRADEQVELLRRLIKEMRSSAQIEDLDILIFDQEFGYETVAAVSTKLPGHTIPFMVEEVGSVGPELVASSLAYGARNVFILLPESTPGQVVNSLENVFGLVQAVLDQTGCGSHRLALINNLDPVIDTPGTNTAGTNTAGPATDSMATFAPAGDKRWITRTALGHFNEISDNPRDFATLPAGSLFGRVQIDEDACTLCMGCVSQCPGKALQAGGDTPALRFIEANCVQCGICTTSCPESALTMEPRLHFDYNTVNKAQTLKEEAPFHCISCGKPFATSAMIARMTEKLKGHWMFEKPEALNRLRMCEDCRVKDMFDKEDHIS